MTLGVRGIARDAAGRVLLVRHSYQPGWFLPGGGVERGQTAYEALEQEMAEEAGVAVTGAPRLFGIYSNHDVFANDHVAVFLVDRWVPCPSNSAGEIVERGFFPLTALPDDTTTGTRRRLAEAFEGAAISARW